MSSEKAGKRVSLFSVAAGSFTTVKENSFSERDIKYRDIMSTARTILREEGVKGFVKGVVPRIFAQAPASAISWTTYEMMKKLLKSQKIY